MKNITCGQKELLSVLFRRGQLSGLPVRNPAELSEAAAARLIAAAAQVPFGTYRTDAPAAAEAARKQTGAF